MKKLPALVFVMVLALSLLTACGGGGGNSSTPSGGNNSTSTPPTTSGNNTPSGGDEKPKVEGIFGDFGLTDKQVTPEGATTTLDGVYGKVDDSHIQATALFPNWDDAAGKAAYPDFIKNVMKAIAEADDYGRPSVDDGTGTLRSKTYDEMVSEGLLPTETKDDGTRWECRYTYGGKEVAFSVSLSGGAQYQITAYFK